jgi:polyhydroxyalkanoate synthesis regulator phasin
MSDLLSAVQESWSKAVLAASSVEEQAEELIARLGQAFQEGPLSPEGAQRLLADVAAKLREHRREVQTQIEDAVRRGLDRLATPPRAELKALEDRLDELERRLGRAANQETSGG